MVTLLQFIFCFIFVVLLSNKIKRSYELKKRLGIEETPGDFEMTPAKNV